ncbi:hypothetical protein DPMN_005157 [Dreissena polymorpha]|uniref:Uncharacterized protein n=1 Tax=Dreissena polymorpha TaxID=45954 RepID=A0A9D4RU58_DREPO|nr:hypothetical protein DPMN_005157 [Dreissena polymorpha]
MIEDQTIITDSIVKKALPFGGQVFQATETIFEIVQDIIETNLLTKFHEDRTINVDSRVLTMKNALPPPHPCHHVFQPIRTIFELIQDIIGTNPLTQLHDNPTINVASRVLTMINTLPLGGHVFSTNWEHFRAPQYFIGINLLTKIGP